MGRKRDRVLKSSISHKHVELLVMVSLKMKMDEHLRGGGRGGKRGERERERWLKYSTFSRQEQFCCRTCLGELFVDQLCEKDQ